METQTLGRAFESGPNNFHLIRLVAALSVIYGHAYAVTGQGGGDIFLSLVGFRFIGGVAVNIFFVVSGFLVASSVVRSSVLSYVTARFLRIFPALWVSLLLVVFVLGPFVTTSHHYFLDAQTWRYLFNNALMIRTEYFLPGVFETSVDKAVNGSLWSLPVEFRLYVAFLLLFLLGVMKTSRYSAFVLAIVLGGYAVISVYPISAQYSNWVESTAFFLAGGLMWFRKDEVRLSFWLAAAALLFCILFHGTDKFYVAYFVGLTYLVFCAAFLKIPRIFHIARTDISYGVYLYGWPVQQVVAVLLPGTGAIVNTLVSCAVSILLGLLSWFLVEKRALSLKRLVKGKVPDVGAFHAKSAEEAGPG